MVSVSDETSIFGVLQESAGGLGRGRSGTLQRDSNDVPVTGKDVCSDLAEIKSRVSIQTVTMITRTLGSSPSWGGDKTSPGDWEINVTAVDWIVRTRMMWQKVQNVTFIRGNDTSSACMHVPSRIVCTYLSHSALKQCRQPSTKLRWLSSCSNDVHSQVICKKTTD